VQLVLQRDAWEMVTITRAGKGSAKKEARGGEDQPYKATRAESRLAACWSMTLSRHHFPEPSAF